MSGLLNSYPIAEQVESHVQRVQSDRHEINNMDDSSQLSEVLEDVTNHRGLKKERQGKSVRGEEAEYRALFN